MSNPFRTKEFKALERAWREKLAETGFVDHEDHKGNLKQPNRRTIGFDSRDAVAEFYRKLDHFITDHPDLPEINRKVLELYSEGRSQLEISLAVGRGKTTVKTIFYETKKRLLGLS